MPANRSRTEHWQRSLQQVVSRGGTIEIAISRSFDVLDEYSDLMWRVRVLRVDDAEILVEQPMAMGNTIALEAGVALIAVLGIGQNRWKFHSTLLGSIEHRFNGKTCTALRLRIPETVERCPRREFERMDTASIRPPFVSVWPLLDPASVVFAETANELGVEMDEKLADSNTLDGATSSLAAMPKVGPEFKARLMNIGGGGVGLLIDPSDAAALHMRKHFWMRIALPGLDAAICVTAKLVHHRIESSQHTYAGMAFDFAFNRSHERFVVDQICNYVAHQQRLQMQHQMAVH